MLSKRLTRSVLQVRARLAHTSVIGIDLGTTNSAVAIMEGDQPKILENEEGGRTTPSVVAFTRETSVPLVGSPAKRQALVNPENTFFATKRLIGRRFTDKEVARDIQNVPYQIVANPENGDAWLRASTGETYSPAQIGGFILSRMRSIAETQLHTKLRHAVVTVPAYFNDSQRQATKTAGQIVGLNVLRVVNEPTAAALAYGLDKKEDGIVAVFDLGGGTFDISILDIEGGVFEVCSTNGDTHLGGEDFDILLLKHIMADFKVRTGIEVSGDKLAVQRIREAAEKAKIELSHVKETTIDLPFITENQHISMRLTEDELDTMSMHLINKTIDPVKRALRDACLKKEDIDEVILVGGMTRMPKIRNVVTDLFGKAPSTAVNPDEAVALGAAIQGAVLSGQVKDVLLLDVTPLSLGIETYGGIFSLLIPRNTTVPAKTKQIFSTAVDGQNGVELRVYQGERSLVKDNKLIGQFKLSNIPAMPKGVPQIEVSFAIDADGIINVSARDKTSGKDASITVAATSGLTEEEVQKMVEDGEKYKEQDLIKKKSLENATRADLICTDASSALARFREFVSDTKALELTAMVEEVNMLVAAVRGGKAIDGGVIRAKADAVQQYSVGIFQEVAKAQKAKK
ncbi:hypothetical protein BABINDRAFT_161056 [Babjeviella inositovora NRRL Y-12698]|uniref:Heat shock protein SSC1, mitochondrial n=1 Tax=Babjeviella inositovora NRRL Y-12698 TaxID=984486 RepID=A0A1E3QT65_9ASCO|nr:uncharacterized protein BABINDRAFT_161056 [Babjeviella inositovora NRRL Y-12698]ODQ80860.1 hypothetical protein BABINDRAFT_161056 [Babjeviella inositovora NRRL Y-12698]